MLAALTARLPEICVVVLGPPVTLALQYFLPLTEVVYPLVWALGLGLDYYSTWRFYREEPGDFERREASPVMKALYRRLGGFSKAAAAFLAVMEAPSIALVALVCMPAASQALSIPPAKPASFFEAALAWLGLLHLTAAATNIIAEKKGA